MAPPNPMLLDVYVTIQNAEIYEVGGAPNGLHGGASEMLMVACLRALEQTNEQDVEKKREDAPHERHSPRKLDVILRHR